MKNTIKLILIFSSIIILSCTNLCKNKNCLNNGICDEGICECPEGFSGINCETQDCQTCTRLASTTQTVCMDDFTDIEQFNNSIQALEVVGYDCN